MVVKRLESERPLHPVLLAAAQDARLTTDFLIERAVEVVREERASADDDDRRNPALLVLQQRGEKALDAALHLLDSTDPAARQLGAQLLRELPGLDSAPYPYSPKIIGRLGTLVEMEPDEEVLCWELAAIGWQCHPSANEVLLRFAGDERASVRHVVANNLLNGCKEGAELPAPVAHALLQLTRDADEDVRWSVFYDVAEYPECFSAFREVFRQSAQDALQDLDERVREEARRAVETLGQGASA